MEKIYTYAKFKIHPGKTEDFKRLATKAFNIVQEKEPGTLYYEWFLTSDETECVAVDCYTGIEAMLAHVANIGPTMRELMTISDRFLEIYGANPSEAVGSKGTAKSNEFYAKRFLGRL